MSDNETKTERQDVCRDFLKNICNRGARCKFFHPSDSPATETKDSEIHFCIDYQNRGCLRENCRFVHVSRDEAERYKMTKEVNLPLARAIAAVTSGDTINGIPVCKEFQTGKCSRGGSRCRYWHVNVEEERERRRRGLPPSGGPMMPPMGAGRPPMGMGRGMGFPAPLADFTGGFGMRRPMPDMEMPFDAKRPRMMGDADPRIQELEKRNAELMKEIEGLKREVQREHERYEDLYALFRQQTGGGGQNAAVASVGQRPAPVAPYGSMQPSNGNWGATQWSG